MATSNLPPRQKMINLIYVILLAMMAINVSSDVMQGFSVLSSHTQQQNGSLAQLNRTLQEKCTQEKAAADSIRQLLDEYTALTAGLREEIARNADKDDYTPGKLIKAEDMKAVPFVMLAPTQNHGKELRKKTEALRNALDAYLTAPDEKQLLHTFLQTGEENGFTWERETFSVMPAIGGVILLQKMEENALFCAHLALRSLKDRKTPQTAKLKNEEKKDMPSAVIVPAERNILYAGIDNPLEVFTLQNGSGALRLDTDNGKMVRKNGRWYLTGARTGKARVTLLDGEKEAGQTEFRIREIPEPEAAIRYTLQGKSYWYKGRTPIRREYLAAMDALEVAYTGENGKIPFTVVRFSTLFIGQDKNVTTLESKGKKFSPQQAEHIRKLNKGDKFYLTSILVKAPDGTTREVQPMDIIIL